MRLPERRIIEDVRERYPEGTRIELLNMDDMQAPPVGTLGTVSGVDDAGSIMVHWDNGSGLSVAYGPDQCRSLVPDFTGTVRRQIMEVRETGRTNMFDVPAVQKIASDMRLYELTVFLAEHQKEYASFISAGHV